MVKWDGVDYGEATTADIRDGYSYSTGGYFNEATEWGYAQFDEWFAEVRAEVWDEAVASGSIGGPEWDPEIWYPKNPYRKEET